MKAQEGGSATLNLDMTGTLKNSVVNLSGGDRTMAGDTITNSAVNRYLQSWDVPNVFVYGASAFPQNMGYNPTGLVGALAYWSTHHIKEQYLRNPGPLVT